MIRISGGQWRGRKLLAPAGLETRPSPARLREALFDVIGPRLSGRPFWDVYAGSGAVGLEALSRGAERALFFENSRRALDALRRNIQTLEAADRCRVLAAPFPRALQSLTDEERQGDAILFLDPPFHRQLALAALEALARAGIGASLLALQTESKFEAPQCAGPWRRDRDYRHGDNHLWIYERA